MSQNGSSLIEYTDDKLIRIKATGMLMDPGTITVLHAVAHVENNRYAASQRNPGERPGKVIIETRAGQTYHVHCASSKQATKLRDTLGRIVNERSKAAAARLKMKQSVDYGKTKLAGDPEYEAERARIFDAFV